MKHAIKSRCHSERNEESAPLLPAREQIPLLSLTLRIGMIRSDTVWDVIDLACLWHIAHSRIGIPNSPGSVLPGIGIVGVRLRIVRDYVT